MRVQFAKQSNWQFPLRIKFLVEFRLKTQPYSFMRIHFNVFVSLVLIFA